MIETNSSDLFLVLPNHLALRKWFWIPMGSFWDSDPIFGDIFIWTLRDTVVENIHLSSFSVTKIHFQSLWKGNVYVTINVMPELWGAGPTHAIFWLFIKKSIFGQ